MFAPKNLLRPRNTVGNLVLEHDSRRFSALIKSIILQKGHKDRRDKGTVQLNPFSLSSSSLSPRSSSFSLEQSPDRRLWGVLEKAWSFVKQNAGTCDEFAAVEQREVVELCGTPGERRFRERRGDQEGAGFWRRAAGGDFNLRERVVFRHGGGAKAGCLLRSRPAAEEGQRSRRQGAQATEEAAEEQGVGAASSGKEEGLPKRARGEGEGAREAKLGARGASLHAPEREPDAQTYTEEYLSREERTREQRQRGRIRLKERNRASWI